MNAASVIETVDESFFERSRVPGTMREVCMHTRLLLAGPGEERTIPGKADEVLVVSGMCAKRTDGSHYNSRLRRPMMKHVTTLFFLFACFLGPINRVNGDDDSGKTSA